jgi:hypothetical protein
MYNGKPEVVSFALDSWSLVSNLWYKSRKMVEQAVSIVSSLVFGIQYANSRHQRMSRSKDEIWFIKYIFVSRL